MDETSEESNPETGKGGLFTKGGKGGPGRGKTNPAKEVPDGLDDAQRMRRVWEQHKGEDANTPQRLLRRMLDGDEMAYFKMMLQLEGKSSGAADVNELPPDEAEDRVRKLLQELLDAAGRTTL